MSVPVIKPLNERFGLHGRRAFVTGGSVSIGRAIALALADAGADVVIQSDLAADEAFGLPRAASDTCADISALSRRATAVAADFRRAGEARRSADEAIRAFGGVDILVICASVQSRQELESITHEEIERQVAINFTATFELLQALLPGMAERGWGRVLSIGSVNQTRPDAQLGLYAALKAAQHNLIINLARQYAGRGVTLNTLSPGLVASERNRWRRQVASEWGEIQKRANPMGRAADPDEMVGAALLLCSPASSFITGADLQATGGAHL
jgi:NAD(P)-dependent dehydrogenase (short-subunit alcohol dehydrogenase family)